MGTGSKIYELCESGMPEGEKNGDAISGGQNLPPPPDWNRVNSTHPPGGPGSGITLSTYLPIMYSS